MKSHISLRRLFSHRRSDERKTIFSWTRPPQGSLGRCRGRSPCPSPRGRPSDRRSPAAARCHQPSHLHERNETMGFRKVSKRFAPTCTVVGWAMEGFGKRVAVARDRDAPMGMISPFCAARLPGPTARTLASLICGHDRGKTRKCQRGMDRRRRLGPTIGGRRLGDCSVGAPETHLRHGRLREDDAAHALRGSDDLLDQNAVEEGD